jgi:hypothetical protein
MTAMDQPYKLQRTCHGLVRPGAEDLRQLGHVTLAVYI